MAMHLIQKIKLKSGPLGTASPLEFQPARGSLKSHIASAGADIKKNGVSAVAGTERQDLENLIRQLAQYGVFLVPAGELECWLPSLNRGSWQSKSEWLIQTFQAMGEDPDNATYLKPATDDVWAFIGESRSWLHNPKRLGISP